MPQEGYHKNPQVGCHRVPQSPGVGATRRWVPHMKGTTRARRRLGRDGWDSALLLGGSTMMHKKAACVCTPHACVLGCWHARAAAGTAGRPSWPDAALPTNAVPNQLRCNKSMHRSPAAARPPTICVRQVPHVQHKVCRVGRDLVVDGPGRLAGPGCVCACARVCFLGGEGGTRVGGGCAGRRASGSASGWPSAQGRWGGGWAQAKKRKRACCSRCVGPPPHTHTRCNCARCPMRLAGRA